MALHRLMEMEVGVPDPAALDDFYQEIGFSGEKGVWGSATYPGQIKISEASYRQLKYIKMACEDEADIAAIKARLDDIGVAYEHSNGTLQVTDPINKWRYLVTPAAISDQKTMPRRKQNSPGNRERVGERAQVITETNPRTPRRLGHVVLGSPDPQKTTELCLALGFRVSDTIGGGMATFMRCSRDHHNLLVTPGPVPYLNHYAMEQDDFDAVMRGATLYLRAHGEEHQIAGPGRHQIGGNIFWYMKDPSGTFFEFFADMDNIDNDAAWVVKDDWDMTDAWSIWGEKDQPELFFKVPDMEALIAGWNASQ
ncbi:MAG: VOC family protein [Pseudomonadales bacterium]|nr:VOC family protein [Pseudomonadales bacterium]